MIITSIAGGMGNQMFMYAAGLSAASRLNTELRLGLWNFRNSPNRERPYSLKCFPGITEREASFRDLWKIYPGLALVNALAYKPIKRYSMFRRLLRKILYVTKIYDGYSDHFRIMNREKFSGSKYSRFYIQDGYNFDFDETSDVVCMLGYWVSEKFFSCISDLVRRKFAFAPGFFSNESLRGIKSSNSVAIHVRRGDKAGEASRDFCCSEPQWIKAAMEKISSLTEKPSFFVFSDDIEWCKENLPKIFDTEYTYLEGNTPAQDMALMTQCRHVIMGPSTFSWWGAWLNDNPGKIIIVPGLKRWMKGKTSSPNLIPSKWIKID